VGNHLQRIDERELMKTLAMRHEFVFLSADGSLLLENISTLAGRVRTKKYLLRRDQHRAQATPPRRERWTQTTPELCAQMWKCDKGLGGFAALFGTNTSLATIA
jgi:hypothetical protein